MSSSIFCYYHMIWRLDINWWCERILSFQEEVKKGYLLTLAWYTNYGLWYSLMEISWLLPQLGGRFKSVTLRVSLRLCVIFNPLSFACLLPSSILQSQFGPIFLKYQFWCLLQIPLAYCSHAFQNTWHCALQWPVCMLFSSWARVSLTAKPFLIYICYLVPRIPLICGKLSSLFICGMNACQSALLLRKCSITTQ